MTACAFRSCSDPEVGVGLSPRRGARSGPQVCNSNTLLSSDHFTDWADFYVVHNPLTDLDILAPLLGDNPTPLLSLPGSDQLLKAQVTASQGVTK